jgi:hypothetical protein
MAIKSRGIAQLEECQPRKCKVLNSNPSMPKKNSLIEFQFIPLFVTHMIQQNKKQDPVMCHNVHISKGYTPILKM